MKLSREGEGGASGLDERGSCPSEHSFTDVGDEPFIAAPVLELERGTVLAGRYQIETTIGKGGSGVVLRAYDRIAEAAVAVKILKPELAGDPRWSERFSRELRLARQIQHANVCRVFDIGEADGHRFLTMELASEGTLRTSARGEAVAAPTDDRIADARALVSGLAAIHAAGIVHRDVKPENLLRMDDGRLVVSDFGLATAPAHTAAITLMVGTPSYMAPEMAMGDAASFRSDVWALGVVMHEILFGKRPEWQVTERSRLFVSPVNKNAPIKLQALARLCAACAAGSPAARPADAREVARRFAQIEGQSGAGAGRSGPRRWRAAALTAVATVGLALVATRTRWPPRLLWRARELVGSERAIEVTDTPLDVTHSARRIATLEGRVHCLSMLPGDARLRVVAGAPRIALDIDITTGARAAATLRPETYAIGCPALSSNGRELLYETLDAAGAHQIVRSRSPDGAGGDIVTKGTFPLWIPDSDDFVFDVDLTHAAVFSLPVMNSSIVYEEIAGQRRLVEAAVSSRGNLLALRYLDDHGENRFVIHSLPTLAVEGRVSLPGTARHLTFDRRTDELGVSVDGPDGNAVLASIDWRTGRARYLAALNGWDLRDTINDDRGGWLVVARKLFNDAWLYPSAPSSPRRLTADGSDDAASLSTTGRLLLQRRNRTGGYVVSLFERAANEPTLTTSGPMDVMPSFADAIGDWFFVRDRRAIVKCDGRARCREVHVDSQMPVWPTADPEGRDVAYLTWLNTPRLKVLSLRTGVVRDLGAALIDCAPVWSDMDHVWVVQTAQSSREWIEIDVRTGARGRARKPAGGGLTESHDCSWSSESPVAARYPQVHVIGRELSELRELRLQEPR